MLKKTAAHLDHQNAYRFANFSWKRCMTVALTILLLLSHLAALPITETFLPVQSAMAGSLASNASLKASAGGLNPFANADEMRREQLAAMVASRVMPGSGKDVEPLGGVDDADLSKTGKKRYLVKFRADTTAEAMAAALAGESFKLVGYSKNRLVRLATDDLAAFREKAEGLLANVEEEVIRQADRTVNDTYASQQWAINNVNLGQAWDITTGTNSFFIAVIDSGIDRSHPDLDQLDIRAGYDYINGSAVNSDGAGHGTAVTGVIAAETNNYAGMAGVSWNAAIIPLRVLGNDGRGTSTNVTRAIRDAADLGCKVINLSLGGPEYLSGDYDAVQYALSKGCIVIASAGNDGTNTLKYPASYSGVISVGSTNRYNEHSTFSNFNASVDLSAPGEQIVATLPYSLRSAYYDYVDGTSFSAPYVSGIAALAVSLNFGLTADQFLAYAQQSSLDLGQPGYDVYYGHGLINAGNLLSKIVFQNRRAITFNSNGGSTIAPLYVESGIKLTPPATPFRTGYTFVGWYKDAACTDDWDYTTEIVTSNITLHALWTARTYTVTFRDWDETLLKTETVNYGSAATAPSVPERTGYTFTGWDRDFSYVTANMTVTAQYNVRLYNVTFNSNGGSTVASIATTYGSTIASPAPPTKAGHTFIGWYRDATCTDDWDFALDTVTTDVTLHAKWTINQYTVTFNSNGGSAVAPVAADYGTKIAPPAPPTRLNYTFSGWFKNEACTDDWDFTTDVVTGNMTLFAKWTINRFTVTFNSNGGSAIAPVSADYGSKIAPPAPPTKPYQSFGGWFKDEACTDDWDFASDTVITAVTLHAKWTIGQYTITFNSNGGSAVAPISADSGMKISEPIAPTRTGHAFGGWFKDEACTDDWNFAMDVVTGEMTLFAKWTINQYTVTFVDWNGSVLTTQTVSHGSAATAPASPTRTGYTFSGWDKPYDAVTTDLTVTAVYTIHQFTVTFNSNGGSAVAPILADYGTRIAAPAAPAKSEYSFAGWFKDAALTDDWDFATDIVTANITLYAKWAPASPQAKVRAFVERFYLLCLGRAASGSEADGWVDALMTKRNTGADVGYGFVFSNEFKARNVSDEDYVTILYKAFFDREPDDGGYNGWLKTLANGMSRYSVLSGFTNSDEFSRLAQSFGIERGTLALTKPADLYPDVTAFVTRFYKLCLNRMPDEGGINAWVGNLMTGKSTGSDVGYGFVFSNEFQSRNVTNGEYVTILYKAFFDREPDAGGYAGWLGVLDRGSTRYHVLTGFTNSDEFGRLCVRFGITRGTLK